jgi:hypothetical protein
VTFALLSDRLGVWLVRAENATLPARRAHERNGVRERGPVADLVEFRHLHRVEDLGAEDLDGPWEW